MTPPLLPVFDNGPLVAFDKPAGVPSIPGRGDAPGASFHEMASAREKAKLFVVHRLDKDTSGLILFARDAATHRRLNALFETRQVIKTYAAWVLGVPAAKEGLVEAPLRIFGSGRAGVDPCGKPAATAWKLVKRGKGKALLDVFPRTGRQHQIRVHLYSVGHPVLGDRLYGETRPVGGAERLLLHAKELSFPWDGPEPLRLSAPPPPDFSA